MFFTKNKNQKTMKIRNNKKKLSFTIFYMYFIITSIYEHDVRKIFPKTLISIIGLFELIYL